MEKEMRICKPYSFDTIMRHMGEMVQWVNERVSYFNPDDYYWDISFDLLICMQDYDGVYKRRRSLFGIRLKNVTYYPGIIRLKKETKKKVLSDMDVASLYPRSDFVSNWASLEGRNPYEDAMKAYKQIVNQRYGAKTIYDKNRPSLLKIEKVIHNDPATIIIWNDGTKTVVKCQDGDVYDPEKGLAMAISKKALGNEGKYYDEFKKWLPEEENHR